MEVIHVGDGHITTAAYIVAVENLSHDVWHMSRLGVVAYSVMRIAVMGPRKMV